MYIRVNEGRHGSALLLKTLSMCEETWVSTHARVNVINYMSTNILVIYDIGVSAYCVVVLTFQIINYGVILKRLQENQVYSFDFIFVLRLFYQLLISIIFIFFGTSYCVSL